MTGKIERDTFEHLVELAALELDEEEADYLRQELNNQLTAIDELAAIPLEADTHPTSHGVPYTENIRPPLREDDWISCPNSEEILAQAPELEEDYFVVPDIPHTDLD
jgi:aspartyl-tRNA(Asn)/glutamyl-tRNA(Gln) amidotransferase subunit C